MSDNKVKPFVPPEQVFKKIGDETYFIGGVLQRTEAEEIEAGEFLSLTGNQTVSGSKTWLDPQQFSTISPLGGSGDLTVDTGAASTWNFKSNGSLEPSIQETNEIGSSDVHLASVWTRKAMSPPDRFFYFGPDEQESGTPPWFVATNRRLYPRDNLGGIGIGGYSNALSGVYSDGVLSPTYVALWLQSVGLVWWTTYAGHWVPGGNGTFDIGRAGNAIRNLYMAGSVIPFTGSHVYQSPHNLDEGDAVKLVNGVLTKCISAEDPAVIGLVMNDVVDVADKIANQTVPSGEAPFTSVPDSLMEEHTTGYLYCVAAVGDSRTNSLSGAKICDEGGPVTNGDYLCTSSTPGFLMKQSDNIRRNYTVGKATGDVSFDIEGKAYGQYILF